MCINNISSVYFRGIVKCHLRLSHNSGRTGVEFPPSHKHRVTNGEIVIEVMIY